MLILDGASQQLLRKKQSLLFDLFKAFAQIVQSQFGFFFTTKKAYFLRAWTICSKLPYNISTMHRIGTYLALQPKLEMTIPGID